MGLQLSKPMTRKVEDQRIFHAQHQLINYLTGSLYIRNLVSKKRRRMQVEGYDLDMSYITDRVLAMSFPAERMRAVYRNPLWQVQSVLDMRHQEHYKVYNLCAEQNYDSSHFHGRIERFPFDDNHVPPLQMIKAFCESVDEWLSTDPKNIVVVHCMAGKGRTGLMVCSYLVYTGMLAEEALQVYATKRTTNNEGVSIPSQRRYVGYWETVLSFSKGVGHGPPEVDLPPPCSRELRRVRLYDTANTESVFFVVSVLQQDVTGQNYCPPSEVSSSCCRRIKHGCERPNSPRYYYSFVQRDEEEMESEVEEEPRVVVQMDTESSVLYQKTCLDYYYEQPLQVTGEVRVIFKDKMVGGRLFYACFNTAFIKNSMLQFSLSDLDKVGKKGRSICGPEFCLELLFGPSSANSCHSAQSDEIDFSDG